MGLNVLFFFSGFFVANIIDTTLGLIYNIPFVSATCIVFFFEEFSKIYYRSLNRKPFHALQNNNDIMELLGRVNFTKMGIIYGLLVDAFKLGS